MSWQQPPPHLYSDYSNPYSSYPQPQPGPRYDQPSYPPPTTHYNHPYPQQPPQPQQHHYAPPQDDFRAPPDVAVDPNSFRRFFMHHLSTLTFNSKPVITNLTLFAHHHLLRMSTVVASCLEEHLRTVSHPLFLRHSLAAHSSATTAGETERGSSWGRIQIQLECLGSRARARAHGVCRLAGPVALFRGARVISAPIIPCASDPRTALSPPLSTSFVCRRGLRVRGDLVRSQLPTSFVGANVNTDFSRPLIVSSSKPSPSPLPPRLHLQEHRTPLHRPLLPLHRACLPLRLPRRRRSDKGQDGGAPRHVAYRWKRRRRAV